MDFSAFIVPIVTLVTAQITAMELARFRFPIKKIIHIFGLLLLVQTVISGSILLFLGYKEYARWFFVAVDLPAFFVFLYVSKRRDMRDVFTTLITIFINILVSILATFLSQRFRDDYFGYSLVRILLFVFVFLALHFFIRKRYLELQDTLDKGWGIFSIQPAIGLIFIYYQYLQYGINDNNVSMLLNCAMISLLIIVVFFVLYYVFKQLHEKHLIQEQQRIFVMQNKAQLDQFIQQKEMTEIKNRRWHDLRHSMQELIDLLEAGKVDTALAYMKEQRGVEHVPKTNYCLHPAVNSILCLWAERSRRAKIELDICTDIPEKLDIDPMELSTLFANAFENSYEGCLRLEESAHKFIKVMARYNGKQLAVGFVNSCLNDIEFENDIPVSKKSVGGIGTKSMIYTIQRFRGTIFFKEKDNVFTTRFILRI